MFGVIKSIPRGASRLQLTAKKGHNFYKGTWKRQRHSTCEQFIDRLEN